MRKPKETSKQATFWGEKCSSVIIYLFYKNTPFFVGRWNWMQPCSRGPHLWPALTSQVKGLRDRGAYWEIKIHREGLNTERFKVLKKGSQRWNTLKERTAESLHRDKDMTSSDIWILRHRPVSWFAADHKQNSSDQLKRNHDIFVFASSTTVFCLAAMGISLQKGSNNLSNAAVVEETQLILNCC